jgi:hypothetical protein
MSLAPAATATVIAFASSATLAEGEFSSMNSGTCKKPAVRTQAWNQGVSAGSEQPHDECAVIARAARIEPTSSIAKTDRHLR